MTVRKYQTHIIYLSGRALYDSYDIGLDLLYEAAADDLHSSLFPGRPPGNRFGLEVKVYLIGQTYDI